MLQSLASILMTNSSLAGNTNRSDGAIYLADSCNLELRNTILWNPSRYEVYFYSRDVQNLVTTYYCDVRQGKQRFGRSTTAHPYGVSRIYQTIRCSSLSMKTTCILPGTAPV
ncbi:MAG TPA: hypothetical protein VMZ04_07630 [Anaerolineae bacterium]|nr:hypothetical protein [Anaerolineae bacterium]